MGLTKRIVVISDIQYPYHDKRALKNVINFIGDYQPDQVIQIGDFLDLPTPSRWSQGTREEYRQVVVEHTDGFKREVLTPLRARYGGPTDVLIGNHDERGMLYLAAKAPALAEYTEMFHPAKLCDFDGFGINVMPPFTKIGPDTVAIHGHEIKGMSQIAGTTAYNHAAKAGINIVMGHTHRLGVRRHTSQWFGGKAIRRWGFEVGNLMDVRKTQYLGAGAVANWQQGFGILYVGKYDVSPYPVDIFADGSFVVEGERYGALKRTPSGKFKAAS
ncbi:hypothetical protein GCM10022252_20100 [Streptosporangium oxazolinicum]|uniref:Calcineurin-like phosphoesterase domain-containing protein n=1 Tax=Streptosporangium oxazolinicum TaxID=909287 RepID=A0ABP8AP62_9ACTN